MSGISQGKLGHHVSELVIIILGVLIALAVDQWNDGRRERGLEAAYLEALEGDLRSDSVRYADLFLPALATKDSALSAIAPVIRGAPLRGDTLAFLSTVALGGRLGSAQPTGLARRTTFDELIATGNLSLIRAPSLRAALVDHYNQDQIQASRLKARVPDYPMAVHAYYPAELRGERAPGDVRAFGLRRAVEGFRSPQFEAVMDQEFNYMYLARAVMQSMADETNELLRRVESARER